MRTSVIVLLIGLITMTLSSCSSCNRERNNSVCHINVYVTNNSGSPVKGCKVYMFEGQRPTNATDPAEAADIQVTNPKGDATFNLNLSEMGINANQTILYFAVFGQNNGQTTINVTDGLTISGNENEKVNLTIPI